MEDDFDPDGAPAGGGDYSGALGASGAANTARDGNVAIQEEYDAARASGNPDDMALFNARYPSGAGPAPTAGGPSPQVVTPEDLYAFYAANPLSLIAERQLVDSKALTGEFARDRVARAYQFSEQEIARINDQEAARRNAVAAQVASELQAIGAWETTSLEELQAEVERRIAAEDAGKGERMSGLENAMDAYRRSLDYGLVKDQMKIASMFGATGLAGKAAGMTYDARANTENLIGMRRADEQMTILDKWLAGKEAANQFGYTGKAPIRNDAFNKRSGVRQWNYNENKDVANAAYNARANTYATTAGKIEDSQTIAAREYQNALNNWAQGRAAGVTAGTNDIRYSTERYDKYAGAALGAGADASKATSDAANAAANAATASANAGSNAAINRGNVAAGTATAVGNANANIVGGIAGAAGGFFTGGGSGGASQATRRRCRRTRSPRFPARGQRSNQGLGDGDRPLLAQKHRQRRLRFRQGLP